MPCAHPSLTHAASRHSCPSTDRWLIWNPVRRFLTRAERIHVPHSARDGRTTSAPARHAGVLGGGERKTQVSPSSSRSFEPVDREVGDRQPGVPASGLLYALPNYVAAGNASFSSNDLGNRIPTVMSTSLRRVVVSAIQDAPAGSPAGPTLSVDLEISGWDGGRVTG